MGNVQILFTVVKDIITLLPTPWIKTVFLPCHRQIAAPNFHIWYLITGDQLLVHQQRHSANRILNR